MPSSISRIATNPLPPPYNNGLGTYNEGRMRAPFFAPGLLNDFLKIGKLHWRLHNAKQISLEFILLE